MLVGLCMQMASKAHNVLCFSGQGSALHFSALKEGVCVSPSLSARGATVNGGQCLPGQNPRPDIGPMLAASTLMPALLPLGQH